MLVERVTGGRKLPAEVMAQIVAKTDGVPLFVEELTKNVLESGLLIEDGDRFRLDGPLPPLAIPSTLQDSLMARLDRLATVKEIAQIGAAIGREFSYALLHAVVDRDEATLRAALAQLEESELVFRSGEPPDARYTFKHALVQDTAYESLLKSRRQILHRRIAEALRENSPTSPTPSRNCSPITSREAGPHRTRDRILDRGGRYRGATRRERGSRRALSIREAIVGAGGLAARQQRAGSGSPDEVRQRPDADGWLPLRRSLAVVPAST